MDINDVKKLISGGESTGVEFKKSTANLDRTFETLCAFINTSGGIVLIGVKDDGTIVGQDVSDATKREISKFMSNFEPPAVIKIEYIPYNTNKYVIAMTASPNHSAVPYTFDGRAYWRIESTTKRMPQHRYNELLLEYANKLKPWDAAIANQIDVDDLDSEEILKTLQESINRGRTESKLATDDVSEVLRRLKLIKNGKITNAAGALFCSDAETDYPQCLIKLMRFKGVSKDIIIDSQRIYGNAFRLLKEGEFFVSRHMKISSEFVQGEFARLEHPEYSLRAIREALVNAICHRDYSIQGGSISIMMYDDRLEVISHGTLPTGIRIEDLVTMHESIRRNEKITNIMYKRGYIESVGMGTQEMIEECNKIGSPNPEYLERGNTFVVVFKSNPLSNISEITQFTNPRLTEILRIMSSFEDGCSTAQILGLMQNPPTNRMLRNNLNELEKDGYVRRVGQGRTTLWLLTKK
jgi:ATP-dependent DNA helicase RecG